MYKKLLFFLLLPVLGISQVQIGLDIDGAAPDDHFGYGVAMSADGSVIAVGAPFNDGNGTDAGHVKVYSNASGTWTQIGDDIEGEAAGDQSGFRVALSADGSVVAIGAPYNDGNGTNSGQVRVYENISGIWTQIGNDIDGQIAGDRFGHGVALSADGSIIAVGAPLRNGEPSISGGIHYSIGSVQIYQNISGVWTQIGQDIINDNVFWTMSNSGWYVDLSADGTVVAIGLPKGYGNRVEVYQNISGIWTQIGNHITKIGQYPSEENGYRVALSADGSVVAMGARFNDTNGNNAGRVSVYENIANNWVQVGSDIFGESAGDRCSMVALSANGEVLAVGSSGSDANGVDSGHVRIFQNISGNWVQQGTNIEGLSAGDWSGFSLALSADGTNLVIGSPGGNLASAKNQVNSIGTNHIRVYDISGILSTNNFISESFDVFPNPVSDVLNIRMKNNLSLEKITVYNNSGQIVKTAQQNTIDVSNLSSGVYFVEITTNQGIATKKVIVK